MAHTSPQTIQKLPVWRQPFVRYLIKFLLAFSVLYFGTLLVIAYSSPGNRYSPFIDRYLDYVTVLRNWLISASLTALRLTGFEAVRDDELTLRIAGTRGVRIVYSCVGYGVMSFWAAFMYANRGTLGRKLKWMALGLVLLFLINVLRICLLAIALSQGTETIFGLDHHTFFGVMAYSLIFLLIFLYDRDRPKPQPSVQP